MGLSPDRVQHFVDNFDYHDPEFWSDPHPVYAGMRRTGAVVHSPAYGGHWVVTGYDAALEAFQHPETFSSQIITVPNEIGQLRPILPIQSDAPDHTRYRKLLAPAFAPRRINALETEIRALCRELIDSFSGEPEIEFVQRFSEPLPTSIFMAMLGLPQERGADFLSWMHRIIHGFSDDPDGSLRMQAGAELYGCFGQLIQDRLAEPRDDLVTVLTQTEIDGERLTVEEILDICFNLFLGGLDTVTSALGLSFLHLGQNPQDRRRLRENPELIPSAVEELVRFESVVTIARIATKDIDFHGCPIRKGDSMLITTASANRDDRAFTDPDSVDLARNPNRHIGFGAGPHRCLGAHLARLEMKVAFEEWHQAFADYRVIDLDKVERSAGPTGGINRLRLALVAG